MQTQTLNVVDLKVANVTSELTKLDDARKANVDIQSKLTKLAADEQAALNGKLAESEAITALTNIHALKAVYGAKVADSASKIARQEKVVLATGRTARQFVAHCQQLFAAYKLDQAVEHVEGFFVGNPLGDARHLALQSKGYISAVRLGDELSAIYEPEQEIGFGLPRLPANWKAVRDVCASEPEFAVEFPAGFGE